MVRVRGLIPFDAPPRQRKKFGWTPIDEVRFKRYDGQPFPLADALSDDACRDLQHADRPLFDVKKTGTKITYVFHPEGQTRFTRQKYAHNCKQGIKVPITYRKAAKQIAEVVAEYIEKFKDQKAMTEGDAWRFGPGYIEFEDLYLVGLRQVDKGSFQPILEVL